MVSKKEKTKKEIISKPEIDLDCEPVIKETFSKTDKKYKCTACGNSWDTQKSHFSSSKSIIYQANNGYITICNSCRDEYYRQLCALYCGNETKAIRHMCMQFGWFFHEDAVVASRQISSDRSRISHYLQKKNLGQSSNIGATDIDTIKFEYVKHQKDVITSKEKAKAEETSVTATAIDRWGVGFKEIDYKNLDEHYRMLKRFNPNVDNNQEIFIKDLCNIHMLKLRALQNGDSKEFANLVKQYTDTFKQAGLRTIEEKDDSNNETFGVTLATISQFTPEEFYKDKKLYDDWDELGEYYDRHIRRPMQNLMFDEDVRDVEFFVPEDGELDE